MKINLVIAIAVSITLGYVNPSFSDDNEDIKQLKGLLKKQNFTGTIQTSLTKKLGRAIDKDKADLGRLIFFDKGLGLHKSNSCSGCHSPTAGWGDTQSIAIGIQNNNKVGPNRSGPRNQRRTPTIANTAFYPVLMWNGRFSSASGSPFNNSKGYIFPEPEGLTAFGANDPRYKHLLVAQAHIPFTELPEMAGFSDLANTGVYNCQVILPKSSPSPFNLKRKTTNNYKVFLFSQNSLPDFCHFDDKKGTSLPKKYPDSNYLNSPIRHQVIYEINQISGYREKFSSIYASVKSGNPIEFWMIGEALSEFQIQQTYANAPIDEFARGNNNALTPEARKGAILFFGKANCVSCHAVKGQSNEMFSDFKMHGAGVPQIAPVFGKITGNVPFRNSTGTQAADGNQDFGQWEFTGEENDRYKFRTSPLRNIVLQRSFFHNGAFIKLADAVRFHTQTETMAKIYNPSNYGVAPDLQNNTGPIEPVLAQLDTQLKYPTKLTDLELQCLTAFLAKGLLDKSAEAENLIKLVPQNLPSGADTAIFEMP